MGRLASLTAVVTVLAVLVGSSGAAGSAGDQVIVPRGEQVQVAFAAVNNEGEFLAAASESIENAIQMATERHPTIRGFPIGVHAVDTSCGGNNSVAATAIVDNEQNTAVLGHICSAGFANALPIYEEAGVVTISGSASASFLTPEPQQTLLGPTVFNRTIVVSDAQGDAGDMWISQIAALPSVLEWQEEYEAEFGQAPVLPALSAMYFDAASLLLQRLQRVSKIANGNLVIDRAALAQAVRATTTFQGVTCKITLDPTSGNRINDQAALARCAEG
jgi:ABC-type branched-subunit amino acid transport system substrate-binding protein